MKPYYSEGGITIYNADCREVLLEGVTVTDPPYNVGWNYDGYSDNLPEEEYLDMLHKTCRKPSVVIHYAESLFALASRIGPPEKVVAWVYPSNMKRQWRAIGWFGLKPDFDLDTQEYRDKSDPRNIELMAQGKRARLYDWWEVNIVKNSSAQETEHPCQIPEFVMKRILKITPAAQLIVDPFCGSGTTLVAAKEMGRTAVGIERNEKYCEIAARRLQQQLLI